MTRRAFAAGAFGGDGRFVDGATTDTTISASIQVLNGRDLQSLEEGERQAITAKAYTEVELTAGDSRTGLMSDRLIDTDATVYEVRRVDVQHPLIGHWKSFLARLDETGGEV